MNIKWATGTVIAVLSAVFLLPGIVSASDPTLTADTTCDGEFSVIANYGEAFDRREYIGIDGVGWETDGTPPAGMNVVQDNGTFIDNGNEDYFEADGSTNDFFTLNGTYQSVQDNGGQVLVELDQFDDPPGPNANFFQVAGVSTAPDNLGETKDWEKCRITYCEAGDTNGGSDLSFLASPDNNCDPVRLCVDGESVTVTEFAAESLNGDEGSCIPSEPPPPPTVTVEPPPEEIEEPETVAEVSPAVEEVVALPSAGYGDTSNSFAWTAITALSLIGIGGGLLLATRRS